MNLPLGFGKKETDFEKQEIEYIDSLVANRGEGSYFSNEFVDDIRKILKNRCANYRKQSEEYRVMDSSEVPERYSDYYVTVLDDASNIVFILRFSHINRKHPVSSDGWAMLNNTVLHHIEF